MQYADDAVYTIRDPKYLAGLAKRGEVATLRESKRWVTAKTLFESARKQQLEMVVLYADAARDCSKLIYWGRLTRVDVHESGTEYDVANLRPLSRHRTQELVLLSTKERIAEGYLRPYALVRRPSFIAQPTAANDVAGDTRVGPTAAQSSALTLFSFGYWGSGSATRALVDAVNQAESSRGFEPPLWVDIRISRSVRAVGFRDHAFEQLLGSQYLHMKDLGNERVKDRVKDRVGGMKIRNPAAATELLDHALNSPRRRVIFFCACEIPGECHRHVVAKLVKAAAARRKLNVNVVEWPGGTPTALRFEVEPSVLSAIARGAQKTIALPPEISVGAAAALPWGSNAELVAGRERLSVLLGPAQFALRGAHLKIIAIDPGPGDATMFRRKHGYVER